MVITHNAYLSILFPSQQRSMALHEIGIILKDCSAEEKASILADFRKERAEYIKAHQDAEFKFFEAFENERKRIIETLKPYSVEQIKLYGIRVFQLPDGNYDSFPSGHPLPDWAELVYDPNL